jgi:hypothetical protein
MAIKEHKVMHDVALANALSWKSAGVDQERERIIKLLDKYWIECAYCGEHQSAKGLLIAAIKGENK